MSYCMRIYTATLSKRGTVFAVSSTEERTPGVSVVQTAWNFASNTGIGVVSSILRALWLEMVANVLLQLRWPIACAVALLQSCL